MGIDPGKEEFIMTNNTINNGLTREVLKPLSQRAPFIPAEHGYTDESHVSNSYNAIFTALVNSNATIAKLVPTHEGTALVDAVKKNTLNAIVKKALTQLRTELESQVTQIVGEVVEKNIAIYSGVLVVADGQKAPKTVMTYGFSVLAEMLAVMARPVIELRDDKQIRGLAKKALSVPGIKEILEYFNTNFAPGLVSTDYLLGIGARYQSFTVEEGTQHQQVLFEMIKSQKMLDAVSENLNASLAELVAVIVPVEETETTTIEEEETMITISKKEFNEMQGRIVEQDAQLVANEAAIKQAMEVSDKQADIIVKLEAMLDELEHKNVQLELHMKRMASKLENQSTQTEKVEPTMTTTTFKLDLDALKEVSARVSNEDKITTKDFIKDSDVSAGIRARIATVETGKKLNEKIRVNAPKAIIATANATHTGIDAVANAAHKTTNFVANATHVTVQHSVNAVDAVLDAIAPSTESTIASAFKQIDASKKEGSTVTIGGFDYKIVDGKYVAL